MDFLGVVVEVRPVTVAARRTSSNARAADGSLTHGEMDRQMDAWRDAQPIVTRCGIPECGWSFEGPAGEARDLAAAHRADAHPKMRIGKAMRAALEVRPAEEAPPQEAKPLVAEAASGPGEGASRPVGGTKQPRKRMGREDVRVAFREFYAEHGHWPSWSEWRRAKRPPSHETVRKLFDFSWSAAVEFAALDTPAVAEPPPVVEPAVSVEPEAADDLPPLTEDDVVEAERLADLCDPKSPEGLSRAVAELPVDVLVAVGRIFESVGLAARDLDPAGRRLAGSVVRDLLDAFLA